MRYKSEVLIKKLPLYDVDNCYVLHNLLNKNIKNDNVIFKRMPTICFGNADRDYQVLELLKRLSPVKISAFACKTSAVYIGSKS